MTETSLSLKAFATIYQDEIAEVIHQSAQELRLISVIQGGGPNLAWVVNVDGYVNGAATFSEGADLNSFTASTDLSVVLQWARYFNSKRLTGTLVSSARGANPAGNQNQMLRQMKAAARDVAESLALEFYVGTGATDHLAGLDVAIHDDNSYGGINRHTTTNHPFDANVFDPGTPTALTERQVIQDINAIQSRCGRKPSFILTSFAVIEKMASLIAGLRNYVIPVQGANGELTFQAGYDAVMIHGVPMLASRNCPITSATNHSIYYVQRDEVELVSNDLQGRVDAGMGVMAEANDSDGAVSLPLIWMPLATNGDSKPFAVASECQLRVNDPSTCGVRRNVNPA